jgi:hypothetical protein
MWSKPTVDAIVAPLGDIVRRLEQHTETQMDRHRDHVETAERHRVHAGDAFKEAQRARAVAEKIAALVG